MKRFRATGPVGTQALIIPAADKTAANAFWQERGAGPHTFSVGRVRQSSADSVKTPAYYVASAQFERFFPGSVAAFLAAFPAASVVSTPKGGNHAARIEAEQMRLKIRPIKTPSLTPKK